MKGYQFAMWLFQLQFLGTLIKKCDDWVTFINNKLEAIPVLIINITINK